MSIPQDEVDELKALWPGVTTFEEAGRPYYLLPSFSLPTGCTPQTDDVLICPHDRDGYPQRLFFSKVIRSAQQRNWNHQNVWIGGRSWNSFSWRIGDGPRRLAQIVRGFLRGLE